MISKKQKIRILFVEDVQSDAELIWNTIKRAGIQFDKMLVETRNEFSKQLVSFDPDLVISDYSLPQFDGFSALRIKNEVKPEIPFILVTGSINEEIAVEVMKSGADDYLIKQNLSRLGSAITGSIEKREIIRHKEYAERELRESEERFRTLFDKAPVGYQSLDENGHLIEVNEKWRTTLGYSYDEVIGKWFGDLLDPEFKELFKKNFAKFKAKGSIHSEFRMIRKDGEAIFAAFEGKIAYTHEGKFKQTHCVLEDVTELRKAERILKESEEQFRRAVTDSPVPIMIHDEDDNVLLLSRGWTNFSGYTIEDIPKVGDWMEAAYGEREGSKKEYIDNLFNINKTQDNGEWRIKTKDGKERIWEFHTTPLGRVNEGKRVLHSLAIDITDQKKLEETLRNKIEELERFNDLTINRELKMVELKREINVLLGELGRVEKYKIAE